MRWRASKQAIGPSTNTTEEQHSPAPTPSRAVYGFLLYLLSNFVLLFYLVWALVPDPWLASLGLDFLPAKYWAVALPIFLSVLFFVFLVLVYPSLGRLRNPGGCDYAADRHTIWRQRRRPASSKGEAGKGGGVPSIYDVPLSDLTPAQLQAIQT